MKKTHCPYCNSLLMKDGHNADGVQRYECPVCYRKSMDREYVHRKCPRCNSSMVVKNGYLKTGEQRYFCSYCGKYFSEKTNFIKPQCTCGSKDVVKAGRDINNRQLFQCNRCGKRFRLKLSKKPNIYEKTCPKCRRIGLCKDGTSGNGKQYWKCHYCGHKFLENGKMRLKNMVDYITILMMLGNTEQRTADLLDISLKSVTRNRQYYEKFIRKD